MRSDREPRLQARARLGLTLAIALVAAASLGACANTADRSWVGPEIGALPPTADDATVRDAFRSGTD